MNCHEMQAEIALLASGDLSHSEARQVREHLAACPSCRAEYEDLVRIAGELSVGESAVLTEIERLRLENTVLRELSHPRVIDLGPLRVRPPFTSLLRIAAALLLVGSGYTAAFYLNRGTAPEWTQAPAVATAQQAEPLIDASLGSHRLSARGLILIARGRAAEDDAGT